MIKRGLVISVWVAILFGQSNLEKGYDFYSLRAEGSIEDQANPKYLNEAIDYYQLALKEPKLEADAALGLMKSYYYKGKYAVDTEAEKKIVFNKAKQLASIYINKYPNRFDILYWYLINLGSWAEVYGIFAAAKEGVADQMKHHAERIVQMDPTYEDGGGYFILGVVHYKSPYIPFILSWPDNDDAVQWLEKSVATGKAKPVQVVYLAQALYKAGEKERALSLLDDITKMTPSKDDPLGDWEQIKKARALLKEYE